MFYRKLLFLFMFSITLLLAQDTEVNEKKVLEKSVEEHLDEQILVANSVIEKINEEKYLVETLDKKEIDKEISYLLNRVRINKRSNNKIAVIRDELRILILEEKKLYNETLKSIIDGKKHLKDKEYFVNLLNNNIEVLEKNSVEKYKAVYDEESTKDNSVSKELVSNYNILLNQSNQQLFTLKYLLENMTLYRTTNFFIDNFNLQYFISYIDSQKNIEAISSFSSYYLKFTAGEILVVLFIILFFRLLNKKIITLLSSLVQNFISKKYSKDEEDKQNLHQYIRKSIEKPLVLTLYLLSIHISLFILIKDINTINQIVPWINTLYMALFTWAIYSLLTNSINNFAQHLVDKYPNVRREMIVFVLRILKIILILLVILFLFSQLGIDIKAIAASLGVGGIAIALASKDTLANFFGSLNIMTDNSFSQGDWIVANDVEGTVVDIRMRTTRIRTFDNAMITVPNSVLANTHIKNYSKRKIGRRIKMRIGITYESKMSDIVNLKNDLYEMLENHSGIATEKNVEKTLSKRFETIKREDLQGVKRTLLVYIDEYDASSINILIYCFARSPKWEDWLTVKEDVLIKIANLVEKNSCEFAYPTQTLHLKGNK